MYSRFYSNTKLVESGDYVYVYEYEYDVCINKHLFSSFNSSSLGRNVLQLDQVIDQEYILNYKENRIKTLHRARNYLIKLVESNINSKSKLVTLTFKYNVHDISYANSMFTLFIQRLNYFVFNVKKSLLQYTAVPEVQQRGAIHYHVIFYNLPYISKSDLAAVWSFGFVRINSIYNSDRVAFYLVKYLTKSNDDLTRIGEKNYFNSRNLKKPSEFYLSDPGKVKNYLSDHELVWSSSYSSRMNGKVLVNKFKKCYI